MYGCVFVISRFSYSVVQYVSMFVQYCVPHSLCVYNCMCLPFLSS